MKAAASKTRLDSASRANHSGQPGLVISDGAEVRFMIWLEILSLVKKLFVFPKS
jgi:hypothetical protein